MKDKPISSSTISHSAVNSQHTVKQMNEDIIGCANQVHMKSTKENYTSKKSATTTECRAFSAHMSKETGLKVSDN